MANVHLDLETVMVTEDSALHASPRLHYRMRCQVSLVELDVVCDSDEQASDVSLLQVEDKPSTSQPPSHSASRLSVPTWSSLVEPPPFSHFAPCLQSIWNVQRTLCCNIREFGGRGRRRSPFSHFALSL